MGASESVFECYIIIEAIINFYLTNLIWSRVSGTKIAKDTCLHFPIFKFSEKLQHTFKIGGKKLEQFLLFKTCFKQTLISILLFIIIIKYRLKPMKTKS